MSAFPAFNTRSRLTADVMKFHYLGQLLFDSNCLLLVLKMFGLSDVLKYVQADNEVRDWK